MSEIRAGSEQSDCPWCTCPWCSRSGVAVVNGLLESHVGPSGGVCPVGGRSPARAHELVDEAISYHAATGDDLDVGSRS